MTDLEDDDLIKVYNNGGDISSSIDAVTVINVLQASVYLFYINAVVMQYERPPLFYGIYDLQMSSVNPPGTFVDRRYSLFWGLLLVQTLRIFMYMFFQMLATTKMYSRWLFEIHRIFNILYLIFDALYLLLGFFLFALTRNTVAFPENPAHDLGWCSTFGKVWTTVCRPDEYTGQSPLLLNVNGTFTLDLISAICFAGLDLVQFFVIKELRISIGRYVVLRTKQKQ